MSPSEFFWTLVKILVVVLVVLNTVPFWIWMERRLVARFQQRWGPNRVGKLGLLQPLADALKLIFKEDITPAGADRVLHFIAPTLSFIPALMALAVIPWGPSRAAIIADPDIGVLYLLALSSLSVYSLVLAGWASNSKYPLLGAVRSSAQMISYELGMGLSLLSVAMVADSLKLSDMVAIQNAPWKWFLIWQFPAFAIFSICALAETNRHPFDLPEAETELVAGYHTEYSGFRFAMFFMAEYIHMVVASAVISSVFLGGWQSPFLLLPGVWWMAIKITLCMFVFIWIRASWPRLRYDQLMRFGWKVLLPLALIWAMTTALLVLIGFYRLIYGG